MPCTTYVHTYITRHDTILINILLPTKPLPPYHSPPSPSHHITQHQAPPNTSLHTKPLPPYHSTQAPPTTSLSTKPLPPHHSTPSPSHHITLLKPLPLHHSPPSPSHHITPLHPFRPSPIATEQWGSLPVHCPFLWQ